jgi:hypothetical protein
MKLFGRLKRELSGGRGKAYVGLAFGISISVAGNVGHAYVPPLGAPSEWEPGPGIVASSVIWPIILFMTLEIMLSIRWPSAWYFHAVRWGVLGGVAFVAAVVSYQHMSGLLKHWGESWFAWQYGPLAVDGLLTMSTAALVVLRMNLAPNDAPAETSASDPPAKKPRAKDPVPPPPANPPEVPAPDAPTNGNGSANGNLTGNARKILDELKKSPGSANNLAARTNIGRTTVDYTLKKVLADQVRQDSDRVWHLTTIDASS